MGDARPVLRTYVSSEIKARARTLAERQLITESVWLRQLVVIALGEQARDETAGIRAGRTRAARSCSGSNARDKNVPAAHFSMRLRTEDRQLLKERASARGMRSATYASVLLRAHLRRLAPLPKEELLVLKQSVAELGAIGRNLNQLARAANCGNSVAGPAREDLFALLKVCEAVRAQVKGLIKANLSSWEIGDAGHEGWFVR